MNKNLSSLFWGLILIVGGGVALAQTMGFLTDVDPLIWVVVFAGLSLLAFAFYFVSGIQNWPMLFPAGIFAALAIILAMGISGASSASSGAPLFVGIALPFVVAYALDRSKNWWALIPTGVMAFLTFVVLVVENRGGEIVGAALFFILAAVFGAVYLSRRMLWAAIVAYIMFVMGFMPLLATGSRPELSGIIMLGAIALPFFFVYFRSPQEKWWALIPAGVLASAALVTSIVLLPGIPDATFDNRLPNALMYLGIALTFAVVGLRHHQRWAVVLSGLAVVLAALNGIAGDFNKYWPVLAVLAGLYMLFNALRPKAA